MLNYLGLHQKASDDKDLIVTCAHCDTALKINPSNLYGAIDLSRGLLEHGFVITKQRERVVISKDDYILIVFDSVRVSLEEILKDYKSWVEGKAK